MPARVETLDAAIREVTAEVLEKMFFSTAVPVECAHAWEECVAARVRFGGSRSGELHVILSRGLAKRMAAGFLAEDDGEVSIEAEAQVSTEIANMICGAVLSRVDPHTRMCLEAPSPAAPGASQPEPLHQCFETPEGRIAVTMRVR
jgi:hypothetical protein